MAKLDQNCRVADSNQFSRVNVSIGFWPSNQHEEYEEKKRIERVNELVNRSGETGNELRANMRKQPQQQYDNNQYDCNIGQRLFKNHDDDKFSEFNVSNNNNERPRGIRGPSGSVRGFRDFVRQSAANLHELNDLRVNDKLIYVGTDSILSRKILEQEETCEDVLNQAIIESDVPDNLVVFFEKKKQQLKEINDAGEEGVEEANEDHDDSSPPPPRSGKSTPGFQQDQQEQQKQRNLLHQQQIQQQQQQQQRDLNVAFRKRQALRKLYLEKLASSERDRCVLYTTSLSVVRRTFDDSKLMRNILTLNLIGFEERDVYLNREYRIQLKLRISLLSSGSNGDGYPNQMDQMIMSTRISHLSTSHFLPCLFVDGRLFCRLKDLEILNETSRISDILGRFKLSSYASSVCKCCGNARFIACPKCNGSRRSMIHHFRNTSVALSCIRCDKNDGLVACPACNVKINDV